MSVEAMTPVEFVTTAQMGEKGQVTVPKRCRDALKLETGAPMVVLRLGAGLLLIPEQARFRQLCYRIADSPDSLTRLPARSVISKRTLAIFLFPIKMLRYERFRTFKSGLSGTRQDRFCTTACDGNDRR
jgi:AbrB family looped-hinge helix DNA binding protein